MTPRVINAAPSLEKAEIHGIDDQRPMSSKIMGMLGRIFIETIPQWLTVGAMLLLIFGGCCSNVFALEAIIQSVVLFHMSGLRWSCCADSASFLG